MASSTKTATLQEQNSWCVMPQEITRELFDRLGAPFRLKTRLLKAEAMEALLHGCMTWLPRREHYRLLQTTHRLRCFPSSFFSLHHHNYHPPGKIPCVDKRSLV